MARALRPGCRMAHSLLRIPNADSIQPQHPSQWWYWSGRFSTSAGERWGFKLSFFAGEAVRGVLWGSMAHAALIQLEPASGAGRCERHSQIWIGAPPRIEGRFELLSQDGALQAHGGDGRDHLLLRIGGRKLALSLRAEREPTCHYDRAAHPYRFGGYSYHYSRTRLRVHGAFGGSPGCEVTGTAWFDRQIGALVPALYQGWQWFALHLDGGELMLFDFNGAPAERFAVWTDRSGTESVFPSQSIRFHATRSWQSTRTGILYPASWELLTPLHRLQILPCVSDQEMSARAWAGPVYWEGTCTVTGSHPGEGYAELVGGSSELVGRMRQRPGLRRLLDNPAVALCVSTAAGSVGRRVPQLRPVFPASSLHSKGAIA